MACDSYFNGSSVIHRLDPRPRIVVGLALAVLIALMHRPTVAATALALAAGLCVAARLPWRPLAKRLAALNAFLLVAWVVLPLTTPGVEAIEVGSLSWSRPGLERVALISLKANAILLLLTALVSTIETVRLGHALRHLKAPARLVHLLTLSIRYTDVLHHEYKRLRTAMRVRCFRPGVNRHTYRTVGYLVGMLLVSSFDRADHILAAMKCRGFRGEFHAFDHFRWRWPDALFSGLGAAVLLGLALLEWL